MDVTTITFLCLIGIFVGMIAALLGIGGGLIIVPILNVVGATPLQATATSLIGVFLAATSASIQNLLMKQLHLPTVLFLALPALLATDPGVALANSLPPRYLLGGFGFLLIGTLFLLQWKKQFLQEQSPQLEATSTPKIKILPTFAIGILAGFLSSLFGVGGGAVMVPLQILFLGQNIKDAVRTSLGAIVLISLGGVLRHTQAGNVLWLEGLCLGMGGLLGAQIGAKLLPQIPEQIISYSFRGMLVVLAMYMIGRALTNP